MKQPIVIDRLFFSKTIFFCVLEYQILVRI
jgi:hypothetical protein